MEYSERAKELARALALKAKAALESSGAKVELDPKTGRYKVTRDKPKSKG